MEKVEVDPKLFVTCRLCLEDMGIYQIIPNIQHQIKYCFDIEVAPFDGLPQLICKKCESILSEYFTIKTAYVAKQQFLISSLQNKNAKNLKSDVPQLPKISALVTAPIQSVAAEKQTDAVPDKTADSIVKNECTKENSPPVSYQKLSKRKRIRIESTSSSSSSDSKNGDGIKVKPLIIRKRKHDRRRKWHSTHYNKHFSCRLCSKSYVKRNALLKHHSSIHSTCFQKYKSILNSLCIVKMEKVDNKPNFTGVNNTIVLSKNKVMTNDESSKYYILYTLKSQNEASSDIQAKNNENESSGSSDDAEYSVSKKKRKKRRRLLSSDTVVIEKKDDNENVSSEAEDHKNCRLNNNSSEIITECINLDSDSEAEPILENKNTDSINEENENKLIRNVIDVCHNKYIRNLTIEKNKRPNYATIESQLMHKVLNLGRKIINRQGLNCTGLLRFLEYRNLGVIWIPKTCHSFSGPPVRITMTTMKKDHHRSEDTDVGWTDVPFTTNTFRIENNLEQILLSSNETIRKEVDVISKLNNDFMTNISKGKHSNQNQINKTLQVENDTLVISKEAVSWQSISDQACLFKYEDPSSSGKLLNENPVANPKQLPKKVTHHEIKQNKILLDNNAELRTEPEINDKEPLLFSEPIEADNDLTGMPIITSTTSLALEYNQIANENKRIDAETVNDEPADSNVKRSAVSVPRIKVKPVSELMPNNISAPNSLLLNQNNINNCDKNIPSMTQLIQQIPYQNMNPVSVIQLPLAPVNNTLPEGQKNNSESFILNTVEMPNTKTDSPFKYLKTLLGIHNIFLMEYINMNDFHCLIKFKVLFKQEAVKPIVLCLSLHCESNRFYIGIRDSTNININMQDLSANWQWEIIKIFQGDVCNKITQTALRMGLDMHDNSKKFLCLVKSIQMKKIEV